MIPRQTITLVATLLANRMFEERCEMLDKKIEDSIRKSFKGERISQERLYRIVDRFCDEMMIKGDGEREAEESIPL